MSSIKCKNCGGSICFDKNSNNYVCDSCGNIYTINDLRSSNPIDDYSGYSPDLISEFSAEELYNIAVIELEAEHWDRVYELSDEMLQKDSRFAKAYLCLLLADTKTFKKEALLFRDEPFDQNNNYHLLMRFADSQLKEEIQGYAESVNLRYLECKNRAKYNELRDEMESATTEYDFEGLANDFSALGDYENSSVYCEACAQKAKSIVKQRKTKFLRNEIITVSIILGVIIVVVGVIAINKASYRADLFSVEAIDKVNVDYDDNSVNMVLKFNIDNESKHNADYLEGYITIKDSDGTVLSSGSTWFSGNIASKNKNYHELSLDMDREEAAIRIWNKDISELVITYRITNIHFTDGTTKEYNEKDIVIN